MYEEKLSKHTIKILEEMYVERDWTEPGMWDEAMNDLVREQQLSVNWSQ